MVIITLALVKVSYDKRAGTYLNITPRQPPQLREPDRYELRVLTFEETLHHLRLALNLIRTHCRSDVQVLPTVSPVPMTQTFREMDVTIANAYSKSVLRTATEHAVFEYGNVHYFPSFESVALRTAASLGGKISFTSRKCLSTRTSRRWWWPSRRCAS